MATVLATKEQAQALSLALIKSLSDEALAARQLSISKREKAAFRAYMALVPQDFDAFEEEIPESKEKATWEALSHELRLLNSEIAIREHRELMAEYHEGFTGVGL